MDFEKQIDTIMGLASIDDSNDDAIIEGLGRRVRSPFNPQQKQAVKNFAAEKSRTSLLSSVQSSSQRYMLAKTGELDKQVQADISSGKARFVTDQLYIRKKLDATTIQMLKTADVEKLGTRNINSNRLISKNIAVNAIKLAYGFSASVTADPANIAYTNAMDAETAGSSPLAIPTAFINGEVEILIEGTQVLRLPVKRFFREGFSVGTGVEGTHDALHLESPILIKENQTIDIIIKCADGVAITMDSTNNHYVEVNLFGASLMPRN